MNKILIAMTCALLASFASFDTRAADPAPSPGEIHLYALNCGEIAAKDIGFFSDTGEYDGRPGTFPATCILIHHPDGWLLWDTGLTDKLVGNPADKGFAKMSRAKSLVDQLGELHLQPKDIKFVAFSHIHSDHTGNANLFKNSTWLMQQKELDYALTKPSPRAVELDKFSEYKNVKKNLLHGDLDVFGDGRVRILSMPGHTPGHQSLLVRLKDEGNVIISGDLFHMRESFEHKRIPIFNTDRADTLASFNRLEGLMRTYKARFFIQHDKDDFAKLPKFPDFWK
jgi:glyoxylase-like metal-dependent hydrolase (beta-lactamase superfamily II)